MRSMRSFPAIVCLAAGLLVQQGLAQQSSAPAGDVAGKFVQAKVGNPEYRANEMFQAYENYYSPRIALLRSKYKLDEVVKNENDEWRRILLLRHWIAEHVRIDNNPVPVESDAFAILDSAAKGNGFHCGHFSLVQHAVLNSFGYVTRRLGCGPGRTGMDGFHGTNEVWVNKFSKWVVVDAKYDKHFERAGVPMSALDIRDEVIKDGGKSIKNCYGLDGRETTDRFSEDVEKFGPTAETYRWIDWEVATNYFTNTPGYKPSSQVLYSDDFSSKNTWVRGGKKNWIIGSNYAIVTTNRGWIEWTPNVIDSNVKINGDQGTIRLDSFTPNLRSYQMSSAKGWEDCSDNLRLKLQKPGNKFAFRTVNLFGVVGPVHEVQIDWQGASK